MGSDSLETCIEDEFRILFGITTILVFLGFWCLLVYVPPKNLFNFSIISEEKAMLWR